MATLLKQATTVTIRLGPFLDRSDGVSEETAITPVVELSKNHSAFGARSSATAIAHDSNGWYAVELNATDTGTLGPLLVKADDSATHLPVWRELVVVPANVYDSLVGGTDTLQADLMQISGAAVSTTTAQLGVNAVAWAGAATAADDVALVAAPANFATLAVTTGGAVTAGTVGDKTGYSLSAAGIQAIWDAATSALTTAGSIGKRLTDNVDALLSSRAAAADYTAARAAKLDNLDALVSSRATPAQVNTEVLDVLTVDTFAEPAAVPAASASLKDKIGWLMALGRNKLTQTSTTSVLRNDGDTANLATSSVSDDGTVFTRNTWT